MADWSVHVENENELSVYDTSAHATLIEIRDLLRQVLDRLPSQLTPPASCESGPRDPTT